MEIERAAAKAVHFSVAFVLAAGFCIVLGDASPPASLFFAAVCTLVEGSLGYGLDNLVLPPVAALMAVELLGL